MADVHVQAVLAREAGLSWPKAAAAAGLHPQTVIKLFKLYKAEGLERIASIPLDPRTGKPAPGRLSDDEYNQRWLERLRAGTVINENGCFVWTGCTTTKGYPDCVHRSRSSGSHRIAYKILKGIELRSDQFVCHSCDNKRCWNPDHLWIGTNSDNQRDAGMKGFHQESKKTHCPKGHPYDEANTLLQRSASGGMCRQCRTCIRERHRRYHQRKMEARRAG